MDPFSMVVAIVFIGCVTGVVTTYFESRVKIAKARSSEAPEALSTELRALRDEVRQLREQQADTILNFDTVVRHLGAPPIGVPTAPAARASDQPAQVGVRSREA